MSKSVLVVAVGSENRAKLSAVQAVFARILNRPVQLATYAVESGVPDQPWDDDIIEGAENRCQKIAEIYPAAEYHVGIESGVLSKIVPGQLLCVELAVIHPCGTLGTAVGMSSGFLVPGEVAEQVEEGIPMSEAADLVFGTENLGQKEGLVGLITDNRLRRNEYIGQAVQLALCSVLKRMERSDG